MVATSSALALSATTENDTEIKCHVICNGIRNHISPSTEEYQLAVVPSVLTPTELEPEPGRLTSFIPPGVAFHHIVASCAVGLSATTEDDTEI